MATKRIYLDTCVFIAVALSEKGRCVEALSSLRAAEAKHFEAVISGLVRAEAIGMPEVRDPQGKAPSAAKAHLAKMDGLFDASYFEYVDLTERLGAKAAGLAAKLKVRGPDACHLMMAKVAGCSEFYTYDKQLLRKNGLVEGLSIVQPEMWSVPGSLFDQVVD